MTSKHSAITSAFSEFDAELDRALPGELLVPEVVELEGERLWWAGSVRTRRLRPGLFQRFLDLAEAPAPKIRDYARRWGVLGICKHGLPASHNPDLRHVGQPWTGPKPILMAIAMHHRLSHQERTTARFIEDAAEALQPLTERVVGCRPLGWDERDARLPVGALAWEPIDPWRLFSRQAHAILKIAERLKDGKVGNAADWQTVYTRSGKSAPWWDQQVDVECLQLARVLNEWVSLGNVRPRISWRSAGSPEIHLVGPNLFSAIALQLTFAVAGSDGVAVCSGCGRAHLPSRRGRTEQRNYCSDCREHGVPLRDAQRDYRRRRTPGFGTPTRRRGR